MRRFERGEDTNYQLNLAGMFNLLYKTCRHKFVKTVDVFAPDTGKKIRTKQTNR